MFGKGRWLRIDNEALRVKLDSLAEEIFDKYKLSWPLDAKSFIVLTNGILSYEPCTYSTIKGEFGVEEPYRAVLGNTALSNPIKEIKFFQLIAERILSDKYFNPIEPLVGYVNYVGYDIAEYFALSLKMPKIHFMNAWFEAQESLKDVLYLGLNERNEKVAEILSEIFAAPKESVKYWQWVIKYDYFSFKNNLLGECNNLEAARNIALAIKNQVKTVKVEKIIKHFGGEIIHSGLYNRATDFHPVNSEGSANFIIFVPKYPHLSLLEKKRIIISELCDYFFEGEASLEEKEVFALTLFPGPK